jgi:hypothetical protein
MALQEKACVSIASWSKLEAEANREVIEISVFVSAICFLHMMPKYRLILTFLKQLNF